MTNIKGNLEKNSFAKECMFMAIKTLLKEKPIDKITISELSETAGISRTTFYRNYSSIYDILEDYFEIHPFGAYSDQGYSPEEFELKARLRDSFELLKKESDIIYALFDSGMEKLLYNNYDKLIKSKCRERAFEIGFRTEYELSAFVGLYYSICYDWMVKGMVEDIETMVDTSYNIIHRFYIRDELAHPERDDIY